MYSIRCLPPPLPIPLSCFGQRKMHFHTYFMLDRTASSSRMYFSVSFDGYIINVGWTLILGLPPKQNGRPIGYITLLMLISWPKCRLSHLHVWGLLCGLLPMAKLAELLLVVRHSGKVPNRKVAKSQLFMFLLWTKSLRWHHSVIIASFTLKITPVNCAYSWALPFLY